MITWDRTGSLAEGGGPSVGKDEESDVKIQHLQCCSPCVYRLRTEGLVPVSKYWSYWSHIGDMGPVNRYSQSATDAYLYNHCFNGCEEREIGWIPTDRSVSVLRCWREHFFLGAVALSKAIYEYAKGWHVRLVMSTYMSCVSGFLQQDVHRLESLWLSDMINRLSCDCYQVVSWIHERKVMD
jgi:hypothetical protein